MNLSKIFLINTIKRIKFRDDINGLRAIAVMAVLLYHLDISYFKGGWLGVDIFFLISGFLISNIIISELIEGTFSFKEFYKRRVNRILPALFFVLIISIPFSIAILSPKAFTEYTNALVSSLFFYANYHFKNLDTYISEPSKYNPLLHTWSLSIEEQFYIIFPLLLFFIFKVSKKRLLLVIFSMFLFSIFLNSTEQSFDKFYGLEFRVWELLLGCLVMVVSTNIDIRRFENFGLVLIFFSIYYFDENWINDVEPKMLALFGTSLILISKNKDTVLTKLSMTKLVKQIGLSSYSLYLLHQPFFAYFRTVQDRRETSLMAFDYYSPNLLEEFILFFIDSSYPKLAMSIFLIIFSFLIFEYIEKKFISNTKYSYFKVSFFIFSVSFFSIFLINKNGLVQYPNGVIAEFANENVIEDEICWNEDPSYNCLKGNSNEIIYLIGDSQLAKIAKELSTDNREYSYFFNVNPYGIDFFRNFYSDSCKDCLYEYLNLDYDKKIVIFNARVPHYFQEEYFYNGYLTSKEKVYETYPEENLLNDLESLIEISDLFILIYPIPEQGWNVRELILNHTKNNPNLKRNLFFEKSYWDNYSLSATKALDSLTSPKIKRVYPSEIFCEDFIPGKCVGDFNKEYFYLDQFHLSSSGADLIVKEIENLLLIEKSK